MNPTNPNKPTGIELKTLRSDDSSEWDNYTRAHLHSSVYHLSGWKKVIEKTYGHKTHYLIATKRFRQHANNANNSMDRISGILPLVHIRHLLFGNGLISIPFFDFGGILANDEEIEKALTTEAIRLAKELNVEYIELRHTRPLSWIPPKTAVFQHSAFGYSGPMTDAAKPYKLRMLLDLPVSPELLMNSFKSKLRSQIKKPMKEGLKPRIGGLELLEDFYRVFLANMRDLGSPVHSKRIIRHVLEEFHESSRIVMVYKGRQPLACSLVVGFKDTLENPWASFLRKHSRLSPNMLLYWTMLKYACDNNFRYFAFGRSSPGNGVYRFK
ncbi:MAG: GNAT family N-acetyltransferase, partial [Thermodesulfobacteriota bacterium]|nr:GNAT family N-acetyltransferase [Thermodesulfobacteriota bacterium]